MRRALLPFLAAAGLAVLLSAAWLAPAPAAPVPVEDGLRVLLRASIAEGSRRSVEDAEALFAGAARVWAPCRVHLDVRDSPGASSRREVRVEFVPSLAANGIADAERLLIRVNDTTTVPPHRALAHEIGHILGLGHTAESRDRLMFQGVNGTRLTPGECARARAAAGELFMIFEPDNGATPIYPRKPGRLER